MDSDQETQLARAPHGDEQTPEDRGRFFAFSDGVFAFAATLLAISLGAPDLRTGQLSLLPSDLVALWPKALAYAISFLVVSRYWGAHRQLFRHIHPIDGVLTAMNTALLLLIALLPFPSAVLGLYASAPVAVALYATTLATIGLLLVAIRLYALSRRLLKDPAGPPTERVQIARTLLFPAVFAASIPVAYLSSPAIATYSWLTLIPLNILVSRVARPARTSRHQVRAPRAPDDKRIDDRIDRQPPR
jgi:uncharacterized membrane protein